MVFVALLLLTMFAVFVIFLVAPVLGGVAVLIPTATFPGHVGPPIAPGALWTSWNTDLLVWLGLVATGSAYLWASTASPRRRRRHRRSVLPRRAGRPRSSPWCLRSTPWASRSSSAHMVQHLLLTTVAAPLLVLAAPVAHRIRCARTGLAPAWRGPVADREPGQLGRAVLAQPVLASLPFVVVLWAWHLPASVRGRARRPPRTRLRARSPCWRRRCCRGRRSSSPPGAVGDRPGLAILVLFGLSTASGLLGVLLTFAPDVLYRSYERTAPAWGLSALADQQLAGVIMWVPGGGVYLAVALGHPDRLAQPATHPQASTSTNHRDRRAERKTTIDPTLSSITLDERVRPSRKRCRRGRPRRAPNDGHRGRHRPNCEQLNRRSVSCDLIRTALGVGVPAPHAVALGYQRFGFARSPSPAASCRQLPVCDITSTQ